jgi:2-keto-3-deoxy-L-rhamnonate aldolase RhmA
LSIANQRRVDAAVMVGTPSPEYAGLAVSAGCSSVILDFEHGYPLDGRVRDVVVATTHSGGRCMVRLTPDWLAQVPSLCDVGVAGIVLSGVRSLEEMAALHDRVVISSGGNRGLNPFVPAATFPGDVDGLVSASRTIETWAMAENPLLLQALTGRTDDSELPWTGIIIGPYDLSVALGCEPDANDRTLSASVQAFAEGAERNGLRWGMFVRDSASLTQWRALGVDPAFVVVGYDRDIWYQECRLRVEVVTSAGNPSSSHPGETETL